MRDTYHSWIPPHENDKANQDVSASNAEVCEWYVVMHGRYHLDCRIGVGTVIHLRVSEPALSTREITKKWFDFSIEITAFEINWFEKCDKDQNSDKEKY